MSDIIRPRGGTAASATSANRTLSSREIGVETDTGLLKVGDGATAWNSLGYAASRKIATAVTSSGTLALGKHTPVDATSGNLTMTLPTGATEGALVSVEKKDATANTVTLSGNIRGVGSSTLVITWQNESITLHTDSSGSWWPTAGHKTKGSLDTAYASRFNPTKDAPAFGMYFPEAHGAVMNGTTDDGTAINAALTAANSGGGGQVYISRNTCTTIGISVPTGTRLTALSRNISIKAITGFPTSGTTPVVNLAGGFGCSISDITIDCNDIAATRGIFSNTINEQCRIERVLVSKFKDRGIDIVNGGTPTAQNYTIEDVELYASSAAPSTVRGLSIVNACPRVVREVTVNSIGLTVLPSGSVGVYLDSCGEARMDNIHVEQFDVGMSLGPTAAVTGFFGARLYMGPNVNTGISIGASAGNSIVLLSVRNSSTSGNVLVDNVLTKTITGPDFLPMYVIGNGSSSTAPFLNLDSGAVGGSSRLTNLTTLGTLTSSGGVVTTGGVKKNWVSKSANYTLTTADEIVFFTTASTATLPSPTANQGRCFTIRNNSAGNVTVGATSGNVDGAATATLATSTKATYTTDGTNWFSV